MSDQIKNEINQLLQSAGVTGEIVLSPPPKSEMGDLAFSCFAIAKEQGKNPVEIAKDLELRIKTQELRFVASVKAFGPYVNFFVNPQALAEIVFDTITGNEDFGKHNTGRGQTVLVEYACPNPMKVFHLGHLRNLITGEAVVRILENAGYAVKRVNYQGDVGMHIAKSLWGVFHLFDQFESVQQKTVQEKVAFLGQAYALGATKFDEDPAVQAEILEYNKKVYEKDPSIQEAYQMARAWSLEYFDVIYKKLGTKFDRLFFESEVFEQGTQLVLDGLKKNIFRQGDGAIIFPGSEYGLHDRVFINSQGFPTYEAKDVGLARLHFSEFTPDKVIHVVGKEQTDYFKVVFQALAAILPQTAGKEFHLVGGYLQLKGEQKMSSRAGNVVSGDELIEIVEEKVLGIMRERELENKDTIAATVAHAALKYSMLRVHASQDMAFDVNESISTSGDSGPYVLYIVTRIRSLLKKAGADLHEKISAPKVSYEITKEEKQLLLDIARFPEITAVSVAELDPSLITKYLFSLAQAFNSFYQACPVIDAPEEEKQFRLRLARTVFHVMVRGLELLGIETVEEM